MVAAPTRSAQMSCRSAPARPRKRCTSLQAGTLIFSSCAMSGAEQGRRWKIDGRTPTAIAAYRNLTCNAMTVQHMQLMHIITTISFEGDVDYTATNIDEFHVRCGCCQAQD